MESTCWLPALPGYVRESSFHYGSAAFPETSTSEFGQIWTDCAKRAVGVTKTWASIMGSSVHAVRINDVPLQNMFGTTN